MDERRLESILLEKEQQELLAVLVEAARNVPQEHREKFIAMQIFGQSLAWVIHPGLPRDFEGAYMGDLEILAQERLINLSYGQGGRASFDVTPLGFRYYKWLKQRAGETIQQVEQEIIGYLDSESFRKRYPNAFAKWREAASLLWEADTEQKLTVIGHLCREALQEFTTHLVGEFQPPDVDSEKSHTIARLKAVLERLIHLGSTEKPFLDALISYWRTVNDLAQRQEHGAQREKEGLGWEDARRVVFHTALVMYEVARAVARCEAPKR